MRLNLFFSELEIKIIEKFNLYNEFVICLQKLQDAEIDKVELKELYSKLVKKKLQELQDKLALDLKNKELLNPFKMTTLDGWNLHGIMKEMSVNGCEAVIIELSSQGLEQNRHWGLNKLFIAGFLNIFPEHIESHGSFENYIKAKSILFSLVKPDGFVIANESNQLNEVLKNNTSQTEPLVIYKNKDYSISDYSSTMYKNFEFDSVKGESYFLADFEVENAIFASKVVEKYLNTKKNLNFDSAIIHKNYFSVAGRMEWVVFENNVVE
jgi:UDP-N-acetylmuramyl tripeptide synthase